MSRLYDACHVIPTHRPLWQRAVLRVHLAYLRWCLRAVIEEREGYVRAGLVLGPQYAANSARQEDELRSRIAVLEVLR